MIKNHYTLTLKYVEKTTGYPTITCKHLGEMPKWNRLGAINYARGAANITAEIHGDTCDWCLRNHDELIDFGHEVG